MLKQKPKQQRIDHGSFCQKSSKRAAKKAMKLLEHMDRTEKGLRDRLHQAGFGQDAIEAAMAYVESYGYIDD